MLKVKVLVNSYGGFRYNGKTEDLERYDTLYFDEYNLTKDEVWKKVWNYYMGCPIRPMEIISIEQGVKKNG